MKKWNRNGVMIINYSSGYPCWSDISRACNCLKNSHALRCGIWVYLTLSQARSFPLIPNCRKTMKTKLLISKNKLHKFEELALQLPRATVPWTTNDILNVVIRTSSAKQKMGAGFGSNNFSRHIRARKIYHFSEWTLDQAQPEFHCFLHGRSMFYCFFCSFP